MPTRIPPLPALRAFESAARHLSLRQAAQELNLTHGAISHQIKFLQEALGLDLIERRGRGIALTPAGQRFAPQLTDALARLASVVEAVQPAQNDRPLRISVLPSFAARWLLPRLSAFMAKHPGIAITLDASLDLVNLHNTGTDLAFRYGPGQWPGVAAELLVREEMLAVCSPLYCQGKLPTQPQDLLQQPLLCDESWHTWQAWFRAAGMDDAVPAPAAAFSDAGLLLQAVLAGQGVALVRSVLAHDDLVAGRLLVLPGPRLPAPYAYYVVTDQRDTLSANGQVFLAWVREQVKAMVPTAPT
ncbi:MAG: transcriptional regulator GcvA [Pseudomonadota bacterium]